MSDICIIDTSVFCNLLGIPHRNQQQDETRREMENLIRAGTTLLLPIATIFETGNHIAQNGDGNIRRGNAQRFIEQVQSAIQGDSPWVLTPMPEADQLVSWLSQFPDWAMRESGFGDLSIYQVYLQQCEHHPARRVFIWSYDKHLKIYDRPSHF